MIKSSGLLFSSSVFRQSASGLTPVFGTPQGGVISPLLANLFLHMVFDKWMEKHFADCPFERYADDIIVHVKNEKWSVSINPDTF